MQEIKEIFEQYELVIINLSKDDNLKGNLKKYDQCKKLLSEQVLEKMAKVKNYQSSLIKMLNYLFEFDDADVADIFNYI